MQWRTYLPTHDEQGEYRGFLSALPEWHAVGVGYLCASVDRRLLALPILGAFSRQIGPTDGHAQDATRELGYVALGAALASLWKRVRGGVCA